MLYYCPCFTVPVTGIRELLDRRYFVLLVSADLFKAFDSLPIGLTLAKLRVYGLKTEALDFIQSYLTERQYFVCIETTLSETITTLKGVPLGSALGSLIWNVYHADLCWSIKDDKFMDAA